MKLLGGAVAVASVSRSALGADASQDAPPVRAFVAASLLQAFRAVVAVWRGSAPGAPEVAVSYGSSSGLARQIELGAPADLFISANALWMDRLVEKGAVEAGTRVRLLSNRLALAAAPGQATALASRPEIDGAIDLLSALGPDGRLAIGRVDSVPLGIYGRTALMRLGLWESVKDRLAEARDAQAALTYVARGATPLGVLYASDLILAEKTGGATSPRRVGLFPEASHDPIVYPAALTTAGAQSAAARDLLGYLRSSQAQGVFREYGFATPEP